jgi:3-keto-5-aminohexanoate cleavage enzyme
VLGGAILDTPIARPALERGGHIRVGLEDHGSGPANLEQVERAVALCAEVGRPIATPTEARSILSLPR